MKPGPAISVRSIVASSGRAPQMSAASSRGGIPARLASVSAILLARSPWSRSRVRSICTCGSTSAGSVPADISACRACWISREI